MKRMQPIEVDTPIVPRAVAEAVWEEASVWLDEPLPRRWIRELIARANTVDAHNRRFHRKIRGNGDTGRDYLWMFTRHWLAALMLERRPHLHACLPQSYNTGHPLPAKPALPARRRNRSRKRFTAFVAAVSCLLSVLRAAGLQPADLLPPAPAGQVWQLAWHDEFDGVRLDTNRWEACGDWKRRDGFWVKDDAFLDGKGHLVLRTRKDGDRFTCGAVRTLGKFEHAFGYWVARCKLPKELGHWPAFWLMCSGVNTIGNEGRDGTEIDVAEFPWRDGQTTMNLHWDGYGKEHKSAGTKVTLPAITNGFHTFAFWWKTNEYIFYVDGNEVWRSAAGGVSQAPEYAKLTEEIGDWAGDIKQAKLPDYFEVDYVRVYDFVAGPAKKRSP